MGFTGCVDNPNSSNNNLEDNEYILTGEVQDFEDSTMLYVNADNQVIDSTMILDGEFSLAGKLDYPTKIFLMTSAPRAYTTLWLEPGEINLKATRDDFFNAAITGTPTNKVKNELKGLLAPIESVTDSLTTLLMQNSMGRLQLSDADRRKMIQEYQAKEQESMKANQQFIQDHPES